MMADRVDRRLGWTFARDHPQLWPLLLDMAGPQGTWVSREGQRVKHAELWGLANETQRDIFVFEKSYTTS